MSRESRLRELEKKSDHVGHVAGVVAGVVAYVGTVGALMSTLDSPRKALAAGLVLAPLSALASYFGLGMIAKNIYYGNRRGHIIE